MSQPFLPSQDPYQTDSTAFSNHTQFVVELAIGLVGTTIMIANVTYASCYLRRRPNRYNASLLVAAILYTAAQITPVVHTLLAGTRSREYLVKLDLVKDTEENREAFAGEWDLKVLMRRIQLTYNILFAAATCMYLLLIQWRFRVLKSSIHWSSCLDYLFVFFTVGLCCGTMGVFDIVLYKGANSASGLAAAAWSAYVLIVDQILSVIFLYKLSDFQVAITVENSTLLHSTSNFTTTNAPAFTTTTAVTSATTMTPVVVVSKRRRTTARTSERERRRVLTALVGLAGVAWLCCALFVYSHFGFKEDQGGMAVIAYRVAASASTLTTTFALFFVYAVNTMMVRGRTPALGALPLSFAKLATPPATSSTRREANFNHPMGQPADTLTRGLGEHFRTVSDEPLGSPLVLTLGSADFC
ncbi:hypothetical protein HKX48_007158 [Thoreauomyces humboldtii]|nr:hypothetical protein HKX48_007158 [Thoreauomyces humboldtii]